MLYLLISTSITRWVGLQEAGAVSRDFERRIWIIAGLLLVGAVLAEGLKSLWPIQSEGGILDMLSVGVMLLAVVLGIYLDECITRRSALRFQDKPNQAFQPSLLQINQELQARTQAQTSQLVHLNVELAQQAVLQKQAEDLARTSEERFHNMADNIQEGLTIIEDGWVVYVNQRSCDIFGDCPQGDLLQRIAEFALPEEVENLQSRLSIAVAKGELPCELQYWIEGKDGQRRCVSERYSASQAQECLRIFIVSSDITASLQAYHSLEIAVSDRTRELSTVLEISKKIASILEPEPLLNLILDEIQSIIPCSGVAIFTLEEDGLNVAAYQVPGLQPVKCSLHLSLENAGPCQAVILEHRVVMIDDVNGESPLARTFNESIANQEPFLFSHARSWIGIPLLIREQVTGLLSLTHRQPGFYTEQHARLAQTVTNQVAVAIENARLYEKAQNLATLEERHRIARELHDSATQLLYGINLYSTAAGRSLRSQNFSQVEKNLAEIKENALQALQEMRLLILELDPPLLQKEGLVAALRASLESIESRTGLETELRTDGVGRLERAIEPELYRIAMEALNNLVRYARAKKVIVDLQARGGWVFLEICDNGVGFDLEQARNCGGMGLHSMEQRARQVGGRLEITSQPGEGTRIRVEIPAQELWNETVAV